MPNIYQTTNKAPTVGANVGPGYPPNASWSNPGNITTDNATSATWGAFEGGQGGDSLQGTTFGFGIPANAVIDGISLTVDGSRSGIFGDIVLLGITGGTGKDIGSLAETYGGSEDLWGATSITPAEVNASGFGVSITPNDTSGGDGIASVDYLTITVFWHYDVDVADAEVPQRYDYKMFSSGGSFLGNLPNVISDYNTKLSLNSVGAGLNVEVATTPDTTGDLPVNIGSLNTWLQGGWAKRQRVTIPKGSITGALSSFPVYLNLADLGNDFWGNVDSAGDDIRITTRYGATELPFELVGFNSTTKVGQLWFKADLTIEEDNWFYIYYGNASAAAYAVTDAYGRNNVWTDYYGVYHLETNANDSTVEANNGAAVASPTHESAKIGQGVHLNGTTQYINLGGATSGLDNDAAGETTFEVSGWFKYDLTTNPSAVSTIFSVNTAAGGNVLFVQIDTNSLITVYDGGTAAYEITGSDDLTDGEYHFFSYSRNGSTGTLYADGVQIGTHTANFTLTAGDLWSIGQEWDTATPTDFFDGIIDEIKVRKSNIATGWQLAQYNNQNVPTDFYEVGGMESEDEGAPDTLIKNGNLIEVWEYSFYHPNGKKMFGGQVNRVDAKFAPTGDNIISMSCHSDGRDMDNFVARGAPFSYTDDQTQTTNDATHTVSAPSMGAGWERCGQTFIVGGGVTNLGRVRLKLTGTANVTVQIDNNTQYVGGLLGSVTQSVNTGGVAAVVDFVFGDFIDVVAGEDYFISISVDDGQSIQVHFKNSTNPYANGAMYTSSYGGGGGGGYEEQSGDDLYFTTAFGTPSTNATYTSKDPTTEMLVPIMDDYALRGGLITYDDDTIDATGRSLTITFKVNTIYEALNKILDMSPSTFYYYVDLGTNILYFKDTNTNADYFLTKGRHIESLDLSMSIENVVNQVLFSGGETAGVNLFSQYDDAVSKALYGVRLTRKSDNRVLVQATADAIGGSAIRKHKDEQYNTKVTVLARTMDISLFRPGQTVALRGFGSFVDNLLLQITDIYYSPERATLSLGTLPIKFSAQMEKMLRDMIAEQTVNNPSAPS